MIDEAHQKSLICCYRRPVKDVMRVLKRTIVLIMLTSLCNLDLSEPHLYISKTGVSGVYIISAFYGFLEIVHGILVRIWFDLVFRQHQICSDRKIDKDIDIIILTHISLASHVWDIGKQCRPRSDAAERGVWSGSTLFTHRNFYQKYIKMKKVQQTRLKWKMDSSNW